MNILLITKAQLPVKTYGGTQRIVWDLGYSLHLKQHSVTFLAGKGTRCDWANVIEYDTTQNVNQQIPINTDIVHFHSSSELVDTPFVVTQHGNSAGEIGPNTIFLSKSHARNHRADAYVHNGLNWDNYRQPEFNVLRTRFHFLGKAAWRVKNVQGAIDITRRANVPLDIMGGHRLNFSMGFRLTLDRHVRFWGMVDNETKSRIMNRSAGLVFPVTWHEPFGLAITESLYFGCPIFGTPYGSLPELVTPETGVLSMRGDELIHAISSSREFSPVRCHAYARDLFNADKMAERYLEYYEQVLNGHALNSKVDTVNTNFRNLPYRRAGS